MRGMFLVDCGAVRVTQRNFGGRRRQAFPNQLEQVQPLLGGEPDGWEFKAFRSYDERRRNLSGRGCGQREAGPEIGMFVRTPAVDAQTLQFQLRQAQGPRTVVR
jgi:hypothetical protein